MRLSLEPIHAAVDVVVRPRPRLRCVATALALAAAVSSVGGACADSACVCAPCSTAITLNMVDASGAPVVAGWDVVAELDGAVVDTSACGDGVRVGNSCSFGFSAGVYEIVVRTPTEQKQLVGRVASAGGQDCCTGCLATETIPVVLGE